MNPPRASASGFLMHPGGEYVALSDWNRYNGGARAVLETLPRAPNHMHSGWERTMARHKVCEVAYKFHGPVFECAYCGEPCDTIDHTIPRWFISQNFRAVRAVRLVKVSACGECNNLAGGVLDRTFSDRKERIAAQARKRGRRLLQTGDFHEDELAELGRGLRTFVARANRDARVLRRRLAVLADPSWPRGVPDDLWEVLADGDDE